MNNLNEIVRQAHGGAGIQTLAQQFGLTAQQAEQAVEALLPALSESLLSRNKDPNGLAAMFGAMFNKQNQDAFETPAAIGLSDTAASGDDAMIRLFENDHASQALAAHASGTSGLSASVLQAMIPVIVSMLMGGLFKGMKTSGLGGLLDQFGKAGANSPGNSSGGLGDVLGQILSGALGGPQSGKRTPRPETQPQTGAPGGILGGMLGGLPGRRRQQVAQAGLPERASQIFPAGLNPVNVQTGIDVLARMLNPGAGTQNSPEPGLQEILGQILGGGRR